MPELPSVTIYVEHLVRSNQGNTLEKVVVASPFVGRTYDPLIEAAHGRHVVGVE